MAWLLAGLVLSLVLTLSGIRLRCGKGWPVLVCSGKASAAASETAPRMPLQLATSRSRAPTRRARWASRRSSARTR
jgi:hypothetical protein